MNKEKHKSNAGSNGTKPAILIVDDEHDIHQTIQVKFHKQIRKGEFDLLSAYDGEEALDIIKNSPINVVFTDLNMPNMDGITFLKHLNKDNGHIPAIVVTAYGKYDILLKAINSGATGFLGKPVDMAELEAMIQQTLNRQEKLKRRIESLERDSIHAEAQMLIYKDHCEELEQQNLELTQRNEALEQQNQKLQQENQAITAQHQGLIQRISELETRLASGR